MNKFFRLSQKDFDKIYAKVPRLCVEIIIKTKKGILLTKRDIIPDKGKWHLPGTTVYFEESLNNAVKRVAKSELGLKIKSLKQIGYIEFLRKGYHPISLVFLVKPNLGKIKLDFQASDFIFTKKIPKNIVKEHKKFLKKYKNIIFN